MKKFIVFILTAFIVIGTSGVGYANHYENKKSKCEVDKMILLVPTINYAETQEYCFSDLENFEQVVIAYTVKVKNTLKISKTVVINPTNNLRCIRDKLSCNSTEINYINEYKGVLYFSKKFGLNENKN